MKEFVLKYQKKTYEDYFDNVEKHLKRLEQNLTELQGLKEQMFTFWNDETARMAGEMLTKQIRTVKNEINTVNSWLTTYRTVTDQLDRGSEFIENAANEAFSALDAVGGLEDL